MAYLNCLLLLFLTSAVFASDEFLEGSGEIVGSQPQPSATTPASLITPTAESSADRTPLQENETEQCLPKVDLAFVLDTSGNVEQIYREHVKWTVELVDALPVRKNAVRIAALQYAGSPITEFSLGTYSNGSEVSEHLKKITFQSGVTRTGFALRKAEAELFREDKGARSDAAKIIILFTDGLSIDDPLKPAQQLRDNKKVKIYVVSVGSDGFEPEMNRIAGLKRNVYGPRDLQQLKDSLLQDIERSQNCPVVSITPKTEMVVHESTQPSDSMNATMSINEDVAVEKIDVITSAPENATTLSVETLVTANEEVTTADIPENRTVFVLLTESTPVENTTQSISELIEEKSSTEYAPKVDKSTEIEATSDQNENQTELTRTSNSSSNEVENSKANKGKEEVEPPQEISQNGNKAKSVDIKAEATNYPEEINHLTEAKPGEETVKVTSIPTRSTSRPTGFSKKVQKKPTVTDAKNQKPSVQYDLSAVTKTPSFPYDSFEKKITKTTEGRKQTTRRPTTPRPYVRRTDGTCPVDMLFVVDSSGSVKSIYDQQKRYVNDILEEAQVADHEHRTALVQFAGMNHQRTEWSFDTYEEKEELMQAFAGVRHFTGTTFIGRALQTALKLLETRRAYVPTVVVLLSDGFSQDDASGPAGTITRSPGVDFYAVSISDLSNTEYLEALTGDPGKVYIGDESEELKRYLIKLFRCEA